MQNMITLHGSIDDFYLLQNWMVAFDSPYELSMVAATPSFCTWKVNELETANTDDRFKASTSTGCQWRTRSSIHGTIGCCD